MAIQARGKIRIALDRVVAPLLAMTAEVKADTRRVSDVLRVMLVRFDLLVHNDGSFDIEEITFETMRAG